MKAVLRRRIQEKLQDLVQNKVAPGVQLSLGYKNETLGVFCAGVRDIKSKAPVLPSTWFDLASITKIVSTVSLFMRALQENKIEGLDQTLKTWLPFLTSDLKNRKLSELLNHRAGLAPIFEETNELSSRDEKIKFFLRRVDETYLVGAPETTDFKATYSDIDFMLLGCILEQIYARRLRELFGEPYQMRYGPLDFSFEWLSGVFSKIPQVATTESLDSKPRKLKGRVQDPRATWFEGDSGHSGVFGTALGVEKWGKELFQSYFGKGLHLSDKTVRTFIDFPRYPDANASLFLNGFDRPSLDGKSQAGRLLSPTATIGHMGYTGCSFWMDIEKGIRVTLLSHRFAPGYDPQTLRNLRPGFHDWLVQEVFSKL